MKIKKWGASILIAGCLLTATACDSTQPKKELKTVKIAESFMSILDLPTVKNKTISYTSQQEVFNMGYNNNTFKIGEYYNTNKKVYIYVLTLEDHPLSEENKKQGVISEKIIRISVGAKPNKDTNMYTFSAISPLFEEHLKYDFEGKSYYLFQTETPCKADDFRIEVFLVNKEQQGQSKSGEQTYRAIINAKASVLYE
ncbi:hypothetical protein [Bacillus sp. 165]|uniref:hypothetical protein n=1 Tax=Bacillus sp. 165 TaxID=1529117 RepID=UPI001AD990BD|nr:hypothetical protein [Bacillus sp. 165]MBO9130405.1 hypothetical protein [Bacillus sp. 165]